jgi:hypothetical protein
MFFTRSLCMSQSLKSSSRSPFIQQLQPATSQIFTSFHWGRPTCPLLTPHSNLLLHSQRYCTYHFTETNPTAQICFLFLLLRKLMNLLIFAQQSHAVNNFSHRYIVYIVSDTSAASKVCSLFFCLH